MVTLLGLVGAGLGLWLAFRSVRVEEVIQASVRVGPWWLAGAMGVNLLILGVKAWRWQVVLQPLGTVTFRDSLAAMMVGLAGNIWLPARLGEAARVWSICRRTGFSQAAVWSGLAVERIVEGIMLIPLFLMAAFAGPLPGWLRTGMWMMVAVLAAGTAVLAWLGSVRTAAWAERVREGYRVLQRPGRAAGVLILSGLNWALQIVMLQCMVSGFGITLPLSATAFVLVAVNVAIALPSTAAGIGPFEFAVSWSLQRFDQSAASAVGLALLYHLVQIVPSALLGAWYVAATGARFSVGGKTLSA